MAFQEILYFLQGHLLTEKVRKVLIDFVKETQGGTVTYAYSTAFQNLLTDIETAKKVVCTKVNKYESHLLTRFISMSLEDQRQKRFPRRTTSDVG